MSALLDFALGRERPLAPESPETESTPRVRDSRARHGAPTEINAMLERVLARQHSLLKKQGVRIRVLLGHRRDLVAMSGRALFDCLSALLAHGLTSLDEDSEAVLRTRDVAGLMCLELSGRAASASATTPVPIVVEQARVTLAAQGGELWFNEEAHDTGFGVTVPLHRVRAPARFSRAPAMADS